MAMHRKQYSYPLRLGNQFSLLVDGDCFYTHMLQAIAQAERSVLLEQYLVESGCITERFIEQLSKAAQRGLHVCVLLDDYGSANLSRFDRERLQRHGVQLQLYNPVHFKHFHLSLFRTHRKLLIIDQRLAFVGGAGIADEFSAECSGPQYWHEVMVQIEGPVVTDWVNLFHKTWHEAPKPMLELNPTSTEHLELDRAKQNSGHQLGRVLVNSPLRQQEINRSLIKHLRRVQQRAWITTPYFVASRKIRRVLRLTARRKVDVLLLLPGHHSDHPWVTYAARRYYMRLLRSGVRIFEYQPRFTHSKILLCDNWVSIGSSNLDRWNQYWNLDANQAVYDADFANEVIELFQTDFAVSREITLSEWQQRPLRTRLREWFSGQLVYLLERFGRGARQGSRD